MYTIKKKYPTKYKCKCLRKNTSVQYDRYRQSLANREITVVSFALDHLLHDLNFRELSNNFFISFLVNQKSSRLQLHFLKLIIYIVINIAPLYIFCIKVRGFKGFCVFISSANYTSERAGTKAFKLLPMQMQKHGKCFT